MKIERLRAAIVPGLFYPESGAETACALAGFGLKPGRGGRAQALIAPHGAWSHSGALAAAAFAAAAGRELSTVVILGPIHRAANEYLRGRPGLFLSESHVFECPLGNIPVEGRLCRELASCVTSFEVDDIPHLGESSIEVLLPFVKFCFPQASIIPILMNGTQPALISGLARGLNLIFRAGAGETLLAVSSNLAAHWDKAEAEAQAERCRRLLKAGNAADFSAALAAGSITPCGGALMAAVLESGLLTGTTLEFPCSAGAGLREDAEPIRCSAQGEEGNIVYYGAAAFHPREEDRLP